MEGNPQLQTVSTAPLGQPSGISGAGMDRKIEVRRRPLLRIGGFAVVAIAALVLVWVALSPGAGRSLKVDGNRITISPVTLGTFEDFIPIRGSVTPRRTVFLDSIEGGRVDERLVEDGAMVQEGQILAVLSNTSLQLDVTRNEAMATEQLNNMRTIELQLEQNRLDHKRNLVEIDYQIKRLGRLVQRQEGLASRGLVVQSQLDDGRDELEYFQNRRTVTLESQAADARLQETQLVFLRESTEQLQRNVAFARSNLDALKVRAPVAGKLSGFDIEVGQSISRGGRLGQIDDPDNFKLSASIDEFYLGRIQIEQPASFEKNAVSYEMTISKIYPQVNNGQFEVDLLFDKSQPEEIRRGQTIQLKLTLG
ncbi:MAG: HlyD family secretion protein, partial [Halieaceae bacterium]